MKVSQIEGCDQSLKRAETTLEEEFRIIFELAAMAPGPGPQVFCVPVMAVTGQLPGDIVGLSRPR